MTTFSEAVSEVKAYIDGKLKDGVDLDKSAEVYVWYGIEKGDDGTGYMHAEISSFHSATGIPIAFDFTAVDDDE